MKCRPLSWMVARSCPEYWLVLTTLSIQVHFEAIHDQGGIQLRGDARQQIAPLGGGQADQLGNAEAVHGRRNGSGPPGRVPAAPGPPARMATTCCTP